MDQALIRRGGQETAEDNQTKISNTMTKVIAINGSPRKNWNTAIMLQSALEGAKQELNKTTDKLYQELHKLLSEAE